MQLLIDGTTEQKFLLMLLERLQKLEGEVEMLAASVRDRNDPWRHLHECDESEVAAHQIGEMLLNNRGSAEITYTGEVPIQAKRFSKRMRMAVFQQLLVPRWLNSVKCVVLRRGDTIRAGKHRELHAQFGELCLD